MNAPVDVDLKARALTSPLEDLDPSDPRIYYDDVWQPYFGGTARNMVAIRPRNTSADRWDRGPPAARSERGLSDRRRLVRSWPSSCLLVVIRSADRGSP